MYLVKCTLFLFVFPLATFSFKGKSLQDKILFLFLLNSVFYSTIFTCIPFVLCYFQVLVSFALLNRLSDS